MWFSALFNFQLTTLRGKHCQHPIAVMGVVDTFDILHIIQAQKSLKPILHQYSPLTKEGTQQ